ncbi:hypothetical protein ACFL96_15465 [Thermoproteota archaeon]
MSKKAQITLFLIMGIILVSAFLFLNYMSDVTVTEDLPAESQKMVTDVLRSGSLQLLVTDCLHKAAKDGVELVGRQGGNIYTHQQGMISPAERSLNTSCPVGYTMCRMGYGIERPPMESDSDFPPPPGYPGKYQTPELNFTKWGRFGKNTLRPLCDTDGANAPWAVTGRDDIIIGTQTLEAVFTPICANNIYADERSTQVQLELFIKNRLEECVNWTDFRNRTGYNVTPASPNITVRYGPANVYVYADYPLLIKVGGVEPVHKRQEFEVNIPIRLKRLAEFASFLVTYDIYKLIKNSTHRRMFNITGDYTYLGGWDAFITVTTDTPYKNLDIFDDFITIEDRASQLEGQNYMYRFVRENRVPALDYIHEPNVYGDYNIITLEGRNITIDPHAYDPDEDRIHYLYFGWKATEDAEYNITTGNVTKLPGISPRNWSNSTLYLETRRNTTYTTNRLDIGAHNVTVYACDEILFSKNPWARNDSDGIVRPYEGFGKTYAQIEAQLQDLEENPLCDWQIVKIFVFDVPVLNATGRNPYDDIPNEYASVEDPYVLDASGTHYVYTVFTKMLWTDPLEPYFPLEMDYIPGEAEAITLPAAPNITEMKESTDTVVFTVPGPHEINFTVDIPLAPTISIPVNVTSCLPHRNWEHPFPYPYHNVQWDRSDFQACEDITDPLQPCFALEGMDVFQANHACCEDGGVFYYDVVSPRGGESFIIEHNLYLDIDQILAWTPTDIEVTFSDYFGEHSASGFITVTPVFVVGNPFAFFNQLNVTFINPLVGPIRIKVKTSNPSVPGKTEADWGTFRDPNFDCFLALPYYGGIFALRAESLEYDLLIPWSTGAPDKQIIPLVGSPFQDYQMFDTDTNRDAANDFFNVTRSRGCSAAVERGNICGGIFRERMIALEACADFDPNLPNQVERCEGGKNDTWDNYSDIAGNGCRRYDVPNTFESVFGLPDKDGSFDKAGACIKEPLCVNGPIYDPAAAGGEYLASGAGCNPASGACDQAVFGSSVSTTRTDQHKCTWWNGRDDYNDDGDYECFKDTSASGPTSKFKTWEWSCTIDHCDGVKTPLNEITERAGMLSTMLLLIDACKAEGYGDIEYVNAGEDGVGGYCGTNFAVEGCSYSPTIPDFCGDQDGEVISTSKLGTKVCCDGWNDGRSLEFTYGECVGHTNPYLGKCLDTGKGGSTVLNAETGTRCWDKWDNDCDKKPDQLDDQCGGQKPPSGGHKDEVICGTGLSQGDLNDKCDLNPLTADHGLKCDTTFTSDNYGFCVCNSFNNGGLSSGTKKRCIPAFDVGGPTTGGFQLTAGKSLQVQIKEYAEEGPGTDCWDSIDVRIETPSLPTETEDVPSSGVFNLASSSVDRTIKFVTARFATCLVTTTVS